MYLLNSYAKRKKSRQRRLPKIWRVKWNLSTKYLVTFLVPTYYVIVRSAYVIYTYCNLYRCSVSLLLITFIARQMECTSYRHVLGTYIKCINESRLGKYWLHRWYHVDISKYWVRSGGTESGSVLKITKMQENNKNNHRK